MPTRRKKPMTKEEIKEAADRAEGKKTKGRKKADPLNPPSAEDLEELEEMPGGVFLPRPKSKRGRPIYKYNPQYATIAAAFLAKGGTTYDLAKMFDISERTVYKWRAMYPEFDKAFEDLGQHFDQRIERRLAERAMGYTYLAQKPVAYKGVVTIAEYEEHIPPDINAIKTWLAARQPEKWRVKDEVELSTSDAFFEMWKNLADKGGKKK